MSKSLLERLANDVRFAEGLKACMNCGICTAICPAAEFFEYDPRSIVLAVQSGDEQKISELLAGDSIWHCGQCMSCKPRCPRGNCPGLLISALRTLSQETGAFTESVKGRQQYLIKNSIGANILEFGYCIHPSKVLPATHPEQGPIWEWIFENRAQVYASVGANLDGDGPGVLRKISDEAKAELDKIFELTGGLDFFNAIDEFSRQKAISLGLTNAEGEADMVAYKQFVEEELSK